VFAVADQIHGMFGKTSSHIGEIIGSIISAVNKEFKIEVFNHDVLVLDVEGYRAFVMITAKSLFYLQIKISKNGKDLDIKKWDWEDIKEIDWERTTGGYIWINKDKLSFLVNYRKPFVDTMKKILGQIKPIADYPIEP
jgi:hypothetical protein